MFTINQYQIDGGYNVKVNPGSPITGIPIQIANNLAAGTYTVALDMTGLCGYYLQYTTLVGTTTMDFQFRTNAGLGYVNITAQKSLTVLANAIVSVKADAITSGDDNPLLPDGQVIINVSAGSHCTAWLIPIPA